jgi:hypothetical protein
LKDLECSRGSKAANQTVSSPGWIITRAGKPSVAINAYLAPSRTLQAAVLEKKTALRNAI